MLKLPARGSSASPPSGDAPTHRLKFLGLVAMYGGLVLFMRVWYGLIRTLSQVKGVPVRKLVMVLALWIVPLLLAPPLFSRDIYSYAAQGEMMSHHISPYHYGPGVLGAAPSVTLVDHLWLNTPVPYGPLFMETDGLLTSASVHHELVDLVLLRLLALVGRRPHGPVDPVAGPQPGPRSVLRLHHGRAQPGHDPAPGGGCPQRCPHARPAHGRPGRGTSRQTGGGHRAVRAGRGGEGPGRLGVLYIGWEWMGTGSARARPDTARGHRRLDRGRGDGRAVARHRARVELGAEPGDPGTVRSWVAPATGAGIFLTDIAHLVGIGVPLHTMLSLTRGLGVLVAVRRRRVAVAAIATGSGRCAPWA